MKPKLAVSGSLLIYLLLAWWMGSLLQLKSPEIWILRGGLALIGVAAVAVWLWFQPRIASKPAVQPAGPAEPLPVEREIHLLLAEAEQRMRKARRHGGARIGSLPVFFLLGDSGSAKTSTMLHSGLDPELLAGQVFQDSQVIPTRLANVWFARRTLWVEAGGALTGDAAAWQHLVRRLEARKIAAVLGGKSQAPRAAVVFFDCENFNAPGASQTVAARARALNLRLQEVAQQLGISFPVYVLFTRMDRLRYFTDFARCLTDEEAGRVFGISLPLAGGETGAYADVQSKRLTEAFDQLFHMAAEARPEFLERENQVENLPNVYEFPREFRKIRTLAVQFLVDLCRPPQLAASPFLRGFYFSGVRPVTVEEHRPAAAASAESHPRAQTAIDATRFFDLTRMQPQPATAHAPSYSPAPLTRRVPQWVFLKQLFQQVLLADQAATAASVSSTKAAMLQRVLLGAATVTALIFAAGLLVSYSANRRLEQRAIAAAQAAAPPPGQPDVSLTDLQHLEQMRQLLVELRQHSASGAPLSWRWGLYTGDALAPRLRQLYFDRFRRLLFARAQNALLNHLRALPAAPGPQDAYEPPYNTLKAYLITTSHHEKSTRRFLAPLLLSGWLQGQKLDAQRELLARNQFEFYSEELRRENPYSSQPDAPAVEHARRYLDQFVGAEKIYQAIIADASGRAPAIQFNRLHPGSAAVLVNKYEIPGAFTAAGWSLVQAALQNPRQGGEDWVLGDFSKTAQADPGQLSETLRARYRKDYITHWRNYLRAASVTPYANFADAARKLNQLSGPQSFLLTMLSLAAKNTAVGDPEIASAFKAVHFVTPPPDLISPNNTGYMKALVDLQMGIEQGAGERGAPDDAAVSQIRTQANAAKGIVRQLALNFGGDPEASTVSRILEEPITELERPLRQHGGLNARGKALCGQLQALLFQKYPFNPRAAAEATPQDLQAALGKPAGALWQFYEAHLRENLIRQGDQYVPAPASSASFTPQFLRFFNAMAHLSDALYPANSTEPRLSYTLRLLPSPQLQNVTLMVDGQKVSSSGSPTPLVWPGKTHSVKGTVQGLSWPNHEGLWSIFRFLDRAKTWTASGSTSILEWDILIGGERAATLRMELGGPPEMVQRGYLSRLGCVSEIVR